MKSIKQEYITLNQLQDTLTNHYQKHKTKLSFYKAVKYLSDNNLTIWSLKTEVISNYISNVNDSSFNIDFSNIYIPISDLLSKFQSDPLSESSIIPGNRDVYAIKHLSDVESKFHCHKYFEFNFVVKGNATQFFEDEIINLTEGELCIISPNSPHMITVDNSSVVINIMIRKSTFDKTFFNMLTKMDLLSIFFQNILYNPKPKANYLLFNTSDTETLKFAIKNIFIESYNDDRYSNQNCISWTNILFTSLLRNYTKVRYYDYQSSDKSSLDFSLVIQYIQDNYKTVTLSSLASYFHYSEAYLSVLIKENLNMNFIEIVTKLKLNQAISLLSNTSLSIASIAEIVGYNNPDHFTRTFKKAFGKSPSNYRATLKTDS